MCLGNSFHISISLVHLVINVHFPRWPPEKLIGAISYEPCKFDRMILYVLLDIWLSFGMNRLELNR